MLSAALWAFVGAVISCFVVMPVLVDLCSATGVFFGGLPGVPIVEEPLSYLADCLSWWLGFTWLEQAGMIGLIALLVWVGFFSLFSESASTQRADDGGPLGNAKVEDGKSTVRAASDTWSGSGTPKSCGLVYGFDGKYLYESATPHTITVSATGGGKTRFEVIPTIHLMAEYGSNLVISDVKNELIELLGDGLEELGYEVLLLDLQHPRRGHRYNPLQIVVSYAESGRIQDAETAAETIAQALIQDEGSNSAHWVGSARGVLSAAILIVALSDECPHDAKTLNTVARLINEGTEGTGADPADRLKDYIRALPADHPARSFASQFLSTRGNELSSIISTVKRNLRHYLSKEIAWMTSGSDIDVRQVLTEKTALFLHVMEEGSPYNAIFSVFFDQLYKETDRICDEMGGSLPRECNIVGDEWGNLPRVNCLAALTSLGRSKGLRWHGIIQNIAQLNKYGKDTDRQKILANCGVKVAIRLNEREDCEYFSWQVGKTTRHIQGTGTSKAEQRTTTSTSYNEHADYVIHEDEWKLRTASRDGLIVIKSGEEGAKQNHAGVFRSTVKDASRTPAKKRFNLGSKEHEAKRKQEYQARLIARAEAHSAEIVPSWCPEWPDDSESMANAPAEPQAPTEPPAGGIVDEFSDYADGL